MLNLWRPAGADASHVRESRTTFHRPDASSQPAPTLRASMNSVSPLRAPGLALVMNHRHTGIGVV